MRIAAALLAAALSFAAPALAQTSVQQAAIERAERVGRDIYDHDRAAWLATDAMFAAIPESERGDLHGWITEREGQRIVVTFVAERNGALRSAYRAVYGEERLWEQGRQDAELTEAQSRLFRARRLVTQSTPIQCSPPYNTVVLPRDDGSADIYLMPASNDGRSVRVGGFQRVNVDLAAQTVREVQIFSRSCLELPRRAERDEVALWFTHLLSDTPTETHVFLNLSEHVDLYVGAGEATWLIHEGAIRAAELPR